MRQKRRPLSRSFCDLPSKASYRRETKSRRAHEEDAALREGQL